MLITIPDWATTKVHADSQGLTSACRSTTPDTPLNSFMPPMMAADPRLAMLRVPKIENTQATLTNSDTWAGTSSHDAPSRATLFNAIAAQAETGNLSADQAQWLAEHKGAPIALWSGVQQITAHLVADPSSHIAIEQTKAYSNLYPIRDIAGFITQWKSAAPNLIKPELIDHLVAIKHTLEDREGITVNYSGYQDALNASLENIANHLKEIMANPFNKSDENAGDVSAFGIAVTNSPESALAFGSDHIMGLNLDLTIQELPIALQCALINAVRLIDCHLHPVATPDELIEILAAFELDDAEYDLSMIEATRAEQGFEDSPEGTEQAIEVCNDQLSMIDCHETYEHYNSIQADAAEINDTWSQLKAADLDALGRFVSEPKDPSDKYTGLTDWLADVYKTIRRTQISHDQASLHPESEGNPLSALNQPLWMKDEPYIESLVQDHHEMTMGGGDDDEDIALPISWTTTPKTTIEQAQRFGLGAHLFKKLINMTETA